MNAAQVYHAPKHKEGLDTQGLVGVVASLASVARDGSGSEISANRPVVVQFDEPKFRTHYEESELEHAVD